MSIGELAAYVATTLERAGIEVVLSGGALVAIYADGRYFTGDIDLVNIRAKRSRDIEKIMTGLGFRKQRRNYVSDQTDYFIEFPHPPLAVGKQRIDKTVELVFGTGIIRALTPTDSVKDRLIAFFLDNDTEALKQAVMLSRNQKVNMSDIRRWSGEEGYPEKFKQFWREIQSGSR